MIIDIQLKKKRRERKEETPALSTSARLMYTGPIQPSKISKMFQEMYDSTSARKSVFF